MKRAFCRIGMLLLSLLAAGAAAEGSPVFPSALRVSEEEAL